ncbi:MAG: ROK family protein [Actinobacteria bacterium]|nr:MAG: ROK family protein [Actinomycetota bacterium]
MKAAIVDLDTGAFVSDRYRIATPQPATPSAMADVVAALIEHHQWKKPLGVAFPTVVRGGIVESAANIDDSWIDVNANRLFSEATGLDVRMVNDADAAGYAEVRLGAGRGRSGVVMMLTFGTGIGSALFIDGTLVPNTEFGHLELDGQDAEHQASARARQRDDLTWKHWAKRVQHYLEHLEKLFSPDLFIAGGGVSKKAEHWLPHVDISTEIVPAEMANNAGIVGAALVANAG